MSDLHFGRSDPAIVEALLRSLKENRPDLVIVSGDLTQRARRSEFAEARRFLDDISAAKLVIPGNHDVPLFDLIARMLSPFGRYEHHIAAIGPVSSFYADDEIAALVLNTARRLTGKNGRISWAQMEEIRRVFGSTPKQCFRILATHHPLGEPAGGFGLELVHRSKHALKAIAEAGVDLLLSGHHHRASIGAITIGEDGDHSVLIGHAGTAVSTRRRGGETNTYNLIRIEPHYVAVAIMTAAGRTGFVESQVTGYVRQAGAWQPA